MTKQRPSSPGKTHPKAETIVLSVIKKQLTVTQAAQTFGVSRQWIYTLIRRYETGGIDALQPRSRAHHTSRNKTSNHIEKTIINLRKHLHNNGCDSGPESIAWHLKQQGINSPSVSTIRRILHRHNMITPEPKKRPKRTYIRFQAALPNECWQADVTTIVLANGRSCEVLDFLDDHSRYLLSITAYSRVQGSDVTTVMEHLIEEYGPPQSTLTDNGLVFTTRFSGRKGGRNSFEHLLVKHRIIQKNGRPNHPQTQGKIERFHQTLKKWLAARPKPKNITAAQKLLNEFRDYYNTNRPHRALAGRTPAQVYTSLPKATPIAPEDQVSRVRCDKVDSSGRISLRYLDKMIHLGVGRAYQDTKVTIIVHDTEVRVIRTEDDQLIGLCHLHPGKKYLPNELRKHKG